MGVRGETIDAMAVIDAANSVASTSHKAMSIRGHSLARPNAGVTPNYPLCAHAAVG